MSAERDLSAARQALQALEQEQRDRFRPAPPREPANALEAYATALNAARTPTAFSIDVGWLT
jgi:hypothetical protein